MKARTNPRKGAGAAIEHKAQQMLEAPRREAQQGTRDVMRTIHRQGYIAGTRLA